MFIVPTAISKGRIYTKELIDKKTDHVLLNERKRRLGSLIECLPVLWVMPGVTPKRTRVIKGAINANGIKPTFDSSVCKERSNIDLTHETP